MDVRFNRLSSFFNDAAAIGYDFSQGESEYLILPNRENPRWVIPVCKSGNIKNAMMIYEPISAKGKLYKWAVCNMPKAIVKSAFRENVVRCNINRAFLCERFGLEQPECSFYLGNGGAHNKLTVQISERGRPAAYLKITGSDVIRALFKNEADILTHLAGSDVRGHVPSLLMHEDVGEKTLFAISTIRSMASKTRFDFGNAHLDFLCRLKSNEVIDSNSGYYNKSLKLLEKISKNSELTGVKEKFISAFSKIDGKVPSVLCHGDFTPWNIYFNGDDIQVFDFEYARRNCPPFFDYLHFHLQVAGLSGSPISAEFLRSVWENAYATEYCERLKIDKALMPALTALYLADIIAEYESRSGEKSEADKALCRSRLSALELINL